MLKHKTATMAEVMGKEAEAVYPKPTDKELYRYKVKKFLEAVALGMMPGAKNWNGAEDATGGFLIVKPNGELVTYHLYNRQALDEYLLLYTKFERPSTSRHKYGFLYTEEDGHLYLKLALQVRFCRPDKY